MRWQVTLVADRITITQDGRKRKMVIKDAKVTDSGMYKCTTNADQTEAEIGVQCTCHFAVHLCIILYL